MFIRARPWYLSRVLHAQNPQHVPIPHTYTHTHTRIDIHQNTPQFKYVYRLLIVAMCALVFSAISKCTLPAVGYMWGTASNVFYFDNTFLHPTPSPSIQKKITTQWGHRYVETSAKQSKWNSGDNRSYWWRHLFIHSVHAVVRFSRTRISRTCHTFLCHDFLFFLYITYIYITLRPLMFRTFTCSTHTRHHHQRHLCLFFDFVVFRLFLVHKALRRLKFKYN